MSVAITNGMRAQRRETLGSRRYLRDGLGMKTGTEEGVWTRVCAGAGDLLEELGSIGRRACRTPYDRGDKRSYYILRILYDRNSTKEGIWKGGMDERVDDTAEDQGS